MPRALRRPIDQLQTLNQLLGSVADPEHAEHARRALEFAYQEHPEAMAEISLVDSVERLARLHFDGGGYPADFAFTHWHVPKLEDFSPLWIRQAIVTEMKKLAGRREALLLVTGLREVVCPEGKYWTQARESDYQRVRRWIDELACAWASQGSRLQVMVF
jgi:hypothetical protein